MASSVILPSHAFHGWRNLSYAENINTCVSIGAYAFAHTNIYASSNTTSTLNLACCRTIGSNAFAFCSSLYRVYLYPSLSEIPPGCFMNCSDLCEVYGLSNIVTVGSSAFMGTKIGYDLVGKSEELANVVFIGDDAFHDAHLGGEDEWMYPDGDRGLWVDRNCVHMGARAFADNPSLRWIGLPGPSLYSSVYTVSDVEALVGSRRLNIDNGQFSGCSGLSNIINLEFQKSFSTTAIVGCNSLPFLNLFYVDSMSNIGGSADMDNVPVSYIHIGPALASQLSTMVSMFQGCSMLNRVTIATSTGDSGYQFSIPDYCFYGISTLTSVEGLYSCSGIGEGAFIETNIEFSNPDQLMYVRNIGNYAFNGTQVDVGYLGNCEYIGASAFVDNPNISELVFGSSMYYIGERAFDSCTNLNVVYFNNDSSSMPNIAIGSNAFVNCSNLTDVCLTNTPQTISFAECCFDSTGLEHLYNLDTVDDGNFGSYMLFNTNV